MKSRLRTIYARAFFFFIVLMFSVTLGAGVAPVATAIEPPEDPSVYPYTIIGIVKDSATGLPISGATVKYYRSSTYIGQSITESTGRFRYFYRSIYPISSFTVSISKSGYGTVTKTQATSDENCLFGVIYLVPFKTYTINGNIKEMFSGVAIPSATVLIYTGATYLGQATTYVDSGYFTYSYTTTATLTTFTAKASKPGYADAEKAVTGSGMTFNIGDMELDTYHTLIASNEFSYNPDSYIQCWFFSSEGNHETSCGDGYAQVFEIEGDRTSYAYVSGHIDLSMWTHLSSIELKVRFRVTNDYIGESAVASATFGLVECGMNPEVTINRLWDESESWVYTTDTGWITRTYIITADELPERLDSCLEYDLFWGYEDALDANMNQHVYLDYVRVYGDSYPGPLTKSIDVYHTGPTVDAFEYGTADHDMDVVGISYGTSITADNTLGFLDGSVTDPHIESSICIALDPDKDYWSSTNPAESRYWYNVVDRVSITISINKGSSPAGGTNIIEFVQVNQPLNRDPATGWPVLGLLNLMAEPLGWVSGPLKLAANILVYLFEQIGYLTYDFDSITMVWGTGYAQVVFDFADNTFHSVNGILTAPIRGHGEADFKMSLMTEVPFLTQEGIYSVDVDYEVGLKQVHIYGQCAYYQISETHHSYSYSDHITLVHLNDFTDVHMVQLSSTDDSDSHMTCTPGSGTTIYDTSYPGDWKVVIGSAITVTAVDTYTREVGDFEIGYGFIELLTSFWKENRLRLLPISTTSRTLICTLDSQTPYYRFDAKYEIRSP